MISAAQCAFCRHAEGMLRGRIRCTAFPGGIPQPILLGTHDHRQPFEGDHGILYEPAEGVAPDFHILDPDPNWVQSEVRP
ncbi:MAG: cytoplasmic protein [Armatimonadetes bacterium]|nr:cytoplasmic protein [Armatimonadota bacterium]